MRTFSGKRSTLALAIAGVTAMSGFMAMPEARAEGFIDDSTLTGGIYYWQRERDRKDVTDGDKYKTNLSHSTWNANLDFQSGYAADKTATAPTRTKSRFQKVIKPMTKTGPATKAV